MKYRYAYNIDNPKRNFDPNKWVTGPDPLRRDKYYAWLKHRAQCKHRQEPYTITWEQWEAMWTDELFMRRGRGRESLCLMRLTLDEAWSNDNVKICTRHTQLKRQQEYRDARSQL